MHLHSFTRILLIATAMSSVSAPVQAQDYPVRAVTIVFPGGAGTGPERQARLLADKLRDKWGQPFIVESKPGAAANLGQEYVAKSTPDGYTLLFTGVGTLVLPKMIYSKLNYDPETFVPISLSVTTPLLLLVHPKVPAQNLRELIALAKSRPGKLNYGTTGGGTTTHLAGELFKSMSGIDILPIQYKSLGPALTDLMGEQIDMSVADIASALQLVRAGRVRALAVTTKSRSSMLPDVPSVGEVLPGYESSFSFVLVAPQGTPAAIVSKLSAAAAEGIRHPDVVRQLREGGTEPVGSTGAEMAQILAQETARWSGVVRALNLKID